MKRKIMLCASIVSMATMQLHGYACELPSELHSNVDDIANLQEEISTEVETLSEKNVEDINVCREELVSTDMEVTPEELISEDKTACEEIDSNDIENPEEQIETARDGECNLAEGETIEEICLDELGDIVVSVEDAQEGKLLTISEVEDHEEKIYADNGCDYLECEWSSEMTQVILLEELPKTEEEIVELIENALDADAVVNESTFSTETIEKPVISDDSQEEEVEEIELNIIGREADTSQEAESLKLQLDEFVSEDKSSKEEV